MTSQDSYPASGALAWLGERLPARQKVSIAWQVDVLKPHEDQPPRLEGKRPDRKCRLLHSFREARGRLAALALAANLASLGPAKARH